jgi:lysozyme
MALGFDVYTKYQTVEDFSAAARDGYTFCYVKVSDGTSTRETKGYGQAGTAAGLAMGAYHYAQPGDPVAQANLLVDQAGREGLLALAPALDLEDPFTPGMQASDFAIAFLQQVRSRGHRPCLYADNTMLNAILSDVKKAVPDVIVWAARYGAEPSVAYDLWQYSENGHIPGVNAAGVDLDAGEIPYDRLSADNGESVSTVP